MTGPIRQRAAPVLAALCLMALPSVAAQEVHRISMESVAFAPQQVKVHTGDVIEWENRDIVAHTATARDRSWDISLMPGVGGRVMMKSPGTISYICRYHPNMTGEIVVEP